jgi:hypothetical protein
MKATISTLHAVRPAPAKLCFASIMHTEHHSGRLGLPGELSGVAQASNLLHHRIPFGKPVEVPGAGGLEIRDTADWKSALRAPGRRGRGNAGRARRRGGGRLSSLRDLAGLDCGNRALKRRAIVGRPDGLDGTTARLMNEGERHL